MHTREDREGLLKDILDDRTGEMSAGVRSGLYHHTMDVDNFLET